VNLNTGNAVKTRYPRDKQVFSTCEFAGGKLLVSDSQVGDDGYFWWMFEPVGAP